MVRTNLGAQAISSDGLALTPEAANVDGNMFDNDGNAILYVNNAGASPITVTLQTPQQVAALDVAEETVSVPNATARYIGRLRPATYNRPVGGADAGKVYVDYSAITSVTVAVVEP